MKLTKPTDRIDFTEYCSYKSPKCTFLNITFIQPLDITILLYFAGFNTVFDFLTFHSLCTQIFILSIQYTKMYDKIQVYIL